MWGIVGDRHGHRSVLIGAGLWWAIGLGILRWAPTLQVYTLAFACIGLSTTATTIADLSLAMEFGSERDRPTYMGLARSLPGLVWLVAPLIGGGCVERGGYPPVFEWSLAFTVCGTLALILLVQDPRSRNAVTSLTDQPREASRIAGTGENL